jgi:hypothetical protein
MDCFTELKHTERLGFNLLCGQKPAKYMATFQSALRARGRQRFAGEEEIDVAKTFDTNFLERSINDAGFSHCL